MIHMRQKYRRMWVLLFLLYLAGLSYFLFFSEGLGREAGETYRYNLEPLKEIRRFLLYRETLGWRAVFLNTAGNVIAFLPFGFFLPLILGRRMNVFAACLAGALFSLFIELTQLWFRLGSFDVDDILLNLLGASAGFWLFRLFTKRRED